MRTLPLLLAPLALLVLAGCGGHDDEAGARPARPTLEVHTGTVTETTLTRTRPLPGTVHPIDQATVAAKVMATVESVAVAIGEEVGEGDILIHLAADELKARVAQAEASLNQVRRNYEREKSLLEQDATTAETVRNLEDEVRLAEARLAEARTMLTYTEVPAPFDGTIIAKQVRRGDLATPGAPLLTIEGEGALRVHVQVPASLTLLEQGARISVEASGVEIEGSLVEWSPAADPTSRTRLAKVQLPVEAPVRSGQFVRVQWPAEEVTARWAPSSAIAPVGQMDRVFVVEEGRAELRFVDVGRARDGRVQILAGLEAGARVVLDPAPELHDGQPVTVTATE